MAPAPRKILEKIEEKVGGAIKRVRSKANLTAAATTDVPPGKSFLVRFCFQDLIVDTTCQCLLSRPRLMCRLVSLSWSGFAPKISKLMPLASISYPGHYPQPPI